MSWMSQGTAARTVKTEGRGAPSTRRRGAAWRAAARTPERGPLRVAMLAPPWIPVPPPGYGGIESVVGLLADALVERGHDVTLFAAPGSRSRGEVRELLDRPHPDE